MQEIDSLFSLCPMKVLPDRPDFKRYIAEGLALTRSSWKVCNNRTRCKQDLV